jgi:hypothetical protein
MAATTRQDEFAVRTVPRTSPADAICGNSIDSRTLIPHGPPSIRLPVYGRVPFKRANPSRTRPFSKQAERRYGRDGNRRDGPSTRRKQERIGTLVKVDAHSKVDHVRIISESTSESALILNFDFP